MASFGRVTDDPDGTMMRAPTIALVLPAYNEARRIGQTITTIGRYVASHPNVVSVTVADDGSSDGTPAIVREAAAAAGLAVGIVRLPHRGKASTIRSAMLELAPRSSASYLMMLDADNELRIDQLDRIEWSDDPDTVYIGRRVAAVGDRISARPALLRRLMSLGMRVAARALLGIPHPDTQCGFKLFPRAICTELFEQQRSTTWTFDAELLYITAVLSRLPVVEVPVTWSPRGESRVRALSAAVSAVSILRTAWHRARKVYRPIARRGAPLAASGTLNRQAQRESWRS